MEGVSFEQLKTQLREQAKKGELETFEVRRLNLLYLIDYYGSIANLNVFLGRKRKDGTLSQIKNQSATSTGAVRKMGAGLAREIEQKLRLNLGWMDQLYPDSIYEATKTVLEAVPSASQQITVVSTDNLHISTQRRVDLTEFLIEKALSDVDRSRIRLYEVQNNNFGSVAPVGTIVLFDSGVNAFEQDGVYVVKAGQYLVLKNIIRVYGGGYTVSDDKSQQQLDDLSSLEIAGYARYIWKGEFL